MNFEIPESVQRIMHNTALDEQAAAYERLRPSYIWRPTLSRDGDAWIALYGENLQEGVVGCGDSPAEAMAAFDKAWHEKIRRAE